MDTMRVELTEARKVVQTATKECDELLTIIGMSTKEVEGKQAAALSKEAELKVCIKGQFSEFSCISCSLNERTSHVTP